MRTLSLAAMTTALFASLALGQTPTNPVAAPSRVFYLTHTAAPAQIQEISNIVRAMTDTPATFDASKKTLTVPGNAEQLAIADWVVSEVDRDTPSGTLTTQPFHDDRGRAEVVRIFALAHVNTPQQLQELTNLIRSISDLQRVFPYNALHQLVARGSAGQIAMADWLIQQLDREPGTPAPDAGTRDIPSGYKEMHTAKVMYLTKAQTPQRLQEVTNQIRSTVKIQRAYPYNTLHALALSGTAEQLAAAIALFEKLDAN